MEPYETIEQLPNTFFWTRMGDEAGEPVELIIERKRKEAENNDGIFWWGFRSNHINCEELQRFLDSTGFAPLVFWSLLKGKAKKSDSNPSQKFDLRTATSLLTGEPVDMPDSIEVPARQTESLALVCRADSLEMFNLKPMNIEPVVFSRLSWHGSAGQKKLAYQNTNALVDYELDSKANGTKFEVIMRALLVEPYIVKLTQ